MAEAMLSRASSSCLLNSSTESIPTSDDIVNSNVSNTGGTTEKRLSFASLPSTDSFRKKTNDEINEIISPPAFCFSNKRQRFQRPSDDMIKRVAEGIKTAVSRSDRLSVLGSACTTFDHDVTSCHDEEVRALNIDAALCKHLAFLIFQIRQIENELSDPLSKAIKADEIQDENEEKNIHYIHNPNSADQSDNNNYRQNDIPQSKEKRTYHIEEEIGYTCTALELVYRCSASVLSESFEKFGNELMDLLIYLLNMKIDKSNTEHEKVQLCTTSDDVDGRDLVANINTHILNFNTRNNRNGNSSLSAVDTYLNKSTKVLCHFARVGSATEPMSRHAGMLGTLQKIIDSGAQSDPNKSIFHHEARANALFALANLACAPSSMIIIAKFPSMINSVVDVINRSSPIDTKSNSLNPSSLRVRARNATECGQATRLIMNLSWKEENKLLFSNTPKLLECLTRQLSFKQGYEPSQRTAMVIKSIRSHAAGALRNIAATPNAKDKMNLLEHDKTLLDVLAETISWLSMFDNTNGQPTKDAHDKDVAEKCFSAIYYLSCEKTAKIIGSHANLFEQLNNASCSELFHASDNEIPEKNGAAENESISILAKKTLKILSQHASEEIKSHGGGATFEIEPLPFTTEEIISDERIEDLHFTGSDDMEPNSID